MNRITEEEQKLQGRKDSKYLKSESNKAFNYIPTGTLESKSQKRKIKRWRNGWISRQHTHIILATSNTPVREHPLLLAPMVGVEYMK